MTSLVSDKPLDLEKLINSGEKENIRNYASLLLKKDGVDFLKGLVCSGYLNIWSDKGSEIVNKGLEELKIVQERYDELEDFVSQENWVISFLSNRILATYNYRDGSKKNAIKYYRKLINILRINSDFSNGKIAFLHSISNVMMYSDSRRGALKYIEEGLEWANEEKNIYWIAVFFGQKGKYYWFQGEPDESLKYFKIGLNKLYKNNTHNLAEMHLIANLYIYVSITYLQLNDTENTLLMFEKASEILTEYPNQLLEAINYNWQTQFYYQIKDFERAADFNAKTKLLTKTLSEKWFEGRIKTFDGLLLIQSRKIIDKAKGEQILRELLEEELVSDARVIVYEGLLQLLLDEIKIADNDHLQQAVIEFETMLNQYSTYSTRIDFFPAIISTMIIRSKMESILKGDLETSKQILDQALKLCNSKGLIQLKRTIEGQIQQLEEQYSQWTEFIEKNPTMGKKIERSSFEDYLTSALLYVKSHEN